MFKVGAFQFSCRTITQLLTKNLSLSFEELLWKNIIKTNELNIVGKLVEVKELKEGTYINAEGTEVPYVSTKLVIKVNAPADEEHLVELQSFTRKFKVDGTESKYSQGC